MASPYEEVLEEMIAESKARLDKLKAEGGKATGLLKKKRYEKELKLIEMDIAIMERELEGYKQAFKELRHPTRAAPGH